MLIPWRVTLAAKFITEATNHHSIKPGKVPTDGPWPAAKLMKKLVTLGPDAWNSGKYTGDTLGMNGYFGLFCEISCDTAFDTFFFMFRISKMLDIELILEKTLKKMKAKKK